MAKGQKTTKAGLAREAALIAGLSSTPVVYFAVGTGDTTPTDDDGALVNEVFRGHASIIQNGANLLYSLTITKGTFSADTSIKELALFDAESGGLCYYREVRDPEILNGNTGCTFTIPVNRAGGSA